MSEPSAGERQERCKKEREAGGKKKKRWLCPTAVIDVEGTSNVHGTE